LKKVICISGKAEAGKTTTANIIKERLESLGNRVVIIPFADYLKFVAEKYFGWNGKKDEEGRHLLQFLGTDKVRKRNEDFWVRSVYQLVQVFWDDFDYVLCDDTRFINEIQYFDSHHMFPLHIRVIRPNHESKLTLEQKNHRSEIELDDFPQDVRLVAETGELPEVINRCLFQSDKKWFNS
jgi:hypothetical protein